LGDVRKNISNKERGVITMKATINRIRKFRTDRDWGQFHTPGNLSKAISIEAAELLENFLWDEENYNKEHVLEELADVMIYCIHMADSLGVDLETIMNSKMDKNEKKYPVEKAKGSSKKYTEL
jgi:NTP pyrophosphatase (non-canonical NTP hydrolase)